MKAIVKTSLIIGTALATVSLAACSGGSEKAPKGNTSTTTTTTTNTAPTAAAPPANSTETTTGATLAQFTGDAAAGRAVFAQCQACHVTDAGVNRVGPSLHGIVGRPAGQVAGFTYSPANANSGITWTPEKLFQYLENPQRVVPGTRMAFAGIADPQRRADLIAYLGTQGGQ